MTERDRTLIYASLAAIALLILLFGFTTVVRLDDIDSQVKRIRDEQCRTQFVYAKGHFAVRLTPKRCDLP